MRATYDFPRPALTVDCVVFGLGEGDLEVLLIKRGIPPFQGRWALPGGFVHIDETLEQAARRELREETGLADVFLEQLYTFGALDRDPRERVVSVAYYALVKRAEHLERGASDAREAAWYPVSRLPPLAFDHAEIFDTAHRRLRAKVRYEPIGFELLPERFRLSELQALYEAVLGHPLDKRNFRKRILSFDLLRELPDRATDGAGRPARLYRFDGKRYQQLRKRGFNFEI